MATTMATTMCHNNYTEASYIVFVSRKRWAGLLDEVGRSEKWDTNREGVASGSATEKFAKIIEC